MTLAVVCVMGPTATGKSAFAIRMAHRLRATQRCEVISADSVMVYKGMDIGSAKPSMDERMGVRHHLVDIRSPEESFSAAEFRTAALSLIRSLHARNIMPIVVGGSMLYLHALRYGISQLPAADLALRTELDAEAQLHGWPELHRRLARVDPVTAAKIHPNHGTRIMRALEVYRLGGAPMSALQSRRLPGLEALGIRTHYRVLLPTPRLPVPRERARSPQWRAFDLRLRERIVAMLDAGLVAECRRVFAAYIGENGARLRNLPAAQAVGYKQVLDYLCARKERGAADETMTRGELALLVEGILSATRRTVRHQLNWLSRFSDLRYAACTPQPAPLDVAAPRVAVPVALK